ncbi:tripartite tricarboxylate transporter substrate-binding protein [Chloroflexota bacterium]
MIVKNMPGGGTLVAGNFVYSSEPDGLTIIHTNFGATFISPVIFEDPAVEFDILKVNYIGSMLAPPNVMAIGSANDYMNLEDLKKAKGLKFAAVQPAAMGTIAAALVSEFFGFEDTKIISGYAGSSAQHLALGRGETDAFVTPASSYNIALSKGFVKSPPVMVFGTERSPYFPDVPLFSELLDLTPEQQALVDITNVLSYADMIEAGPPGIPEDRLKFMREKFLEINALPAFQRITKNIWPVWVEPKTAEEIEAIQKMTASVAPEEVAKLKELTEKYISIIK